MPGPVFQLREIIVKIAHFCLLTAAALPAMAAPAMFPKPLHMVRRVEDPFAKKPVVVDQYCTGDRIVTVSGKRVTIVDYAQQQVTEIDHDAATYSVTRFDEIARAKAPSSRAASAAPQTASAAPKVTPLGVRSSAGGRSVDSFEIEMQRMKIVAGVDRSVPLSRDAFEALIGAAYPNARRPEHDALVGAAAGPGTRGRIASNSTAETSDYGLPAEQTVTVQNEDGSTITTKTSLLHLDGDLPPPALLNIEPGAKRVESRITRFAHEMHEADTIPTAPGH